ncbi:hypothetical protein [Bradyrhizobium sp.]|nr:hypothetical protein [Bradyrhizobium sp.]
MNVAAVAAGLLIVRPLLLQARIVVAPRSATLHLCRIIILGTL